VNEYLAALGIASTLHQCRRWYGTAVYEASLSPILSQNLLGHIDPRTTALYLAFSPIKASAVVAQIGVEAIPESQRRTFLYCSHCETRPLWNVERPLCRRCWTYQRRHDGRLPPLPEFGSATAGVLEARERLGPNASAKELAQEAGVHHNTVYRVLNPNQRQRERDEERLKKLAALYTVGGANEKPEAIAARMPERLRREYIRLVEMARRT
jgi:hypothetical protein